MKRGRSTKAPTKSEADWIVACKEASCLCCVIWAQATGYGLAPFEGNDFHHLLSGGRRRGHRFGIGICPWHHRAVPVDGYSAAEMSAVFGPSLMNGSRPFRNAYGSDDELLTKQEKLLENGYL